MENDSLIMLLEGVLFLVVGIYGFYYMVKLLRSGYTDPLGNDIKVYFGSGMAVILGLVLIIKSIFY